MNRVTIAAVQTRPRILRKAANLDQCLESMDVAAENGADLLVFPECALTGYCFSSLEESLSVAESIPGPSTDDFAARCSELDVYSVLGLLEIADGRCYNALAFLGPEGLVGKYRKTHLPYLGVDRFVAPGDTPLEVYDTAVGRIGLNICFDVRFPEPARVLALNGADLIALPTNWPVGAESVPDYLVNARAIENRVSYVAANRVGTERGFRFIGRSKIVDYRGRTLAEASPDGEEIIYGTIDLEPARDKHIVVTPGEYELPLFTSRRPELYAALVERWG